MNTKFSQEQIGRKKYRFWETFSYSSKQKDTFLTSHVKAILIDQWGYHHEQKRCTLFLYTQYVDNTHVKEPSACKNLPNLPKRQIGRMFLEKYYPLRFWVNFPILANSICILCNLCMYKDNSDALIGQWAYHHKHKIHTLLCTQSM
jgi:hypothetical protein